MEELCNAVFNNELDLVRNHLSYCKTLAKNYRDFSNPLHIAAKYNRVDIMKVLLTESSPEFVDYYINKFISDQTPLMAVFVNDNYQEIIMLLLKHGADPQLENQNGQSFFKTIITFRKKKLINLVLPYVDVNIADKNSNNILFHVLNDYEEDSSEVIQLLCDYGVDYHHENNIKQTPLDIAQSKSLPLLDIISENKVTCRHQLKVYMLGDQNVNDFLLGKFQHFEKNYLEIIDLKVSEISFENRSKVAFWNIPQKSKYQRIHKVLLNYKLSAVFFSFDITLRIDQKLILKELLFWLHFICDTKKELDFMAFCIVFLADERTANMEDSIRNDPKISKILEKNFYNKDIKFFTVTKKENCIAYRMLKNYILNLATAKTKCFLNNEECIKNNETKLSLNISLESIKNGNLLHKQNINHVMKHAILQFCEENQLIKIELVSNSSIIIVHPKKFFDAIENIFKTQDKPMLGPVNKWNMLILDLLKEHDIIVRNFTQYFATLHLPSLEITSFKHVLKKNSKIFLNIYECDEPAFAEINFTQIQYELYTHLESKLTVYCDAIHYNNGYSHFFIVLKRSNKKINVWILDKNEDEDHQLLKLICDTITKINYHLIRTYNENDSAKEVLNYCLKLLKNSKDPFKIFNSEHNEEFVKELMFQVSIEHLPEAVQKFMFQNLNCLIGKKAGYKILDEFFGNNGQDISPSMETLFKKNRNLDIKSLMELLNKADMGMLSYKLEMFILSLFL